MCMMCDGASRDEVLFDQHGIITRHGWMVLGVERHPPTPEWAYTIGLATTFEHPELVIVGAHYKTAGLMLNAIGESVRSGDRYDVGDTAQIGAIEVTFGEIHPAHIDRGLVNQWGEYFIALGPPYPDLRVLQVVLASRFRLDTDDDVMCLSRW